MYKVQLYRSTKRFLFKEKGKKTQSHLKHMLRTLINLYLGSLKSEAFTVLAIEDFLPLKVSPVVPGVK